MMSKFKRILGTNYNMKKITYLEDYREYGVVTYTEVIIERRK